jgi:hypothetical protein
MKTRAILAVAGLAAITGAANAQIQTTNATIGYTLTWQDSGDNDGLLEPGEHATVRLTATMTPAVNTVISYTNNGNSASGTLRGIASSFLDINGGNTNGGTIAGQLIDPTWDLTGTVPSISGQSQQNLQFGQFPVNNNGINTQNPLTNVYEFTWTPSDFTSRTATFTTAAGSASNGLASAVYIITGATTRVVANALSTFGAVSIPVVPAPSSLALLGLGGLIVGRRRR